MARGPCPICGKVLTRMPSHIRHHFKDMPPGQEKNDRIRLWEKEAKYLRERLAGKHGREKQETTERLMGANRPRSRRL